MLVKVLMLIQMLMLLLLAGNMANAGIDGVGIGAGFEIFVHFVGLSYIYLLYIFFFRIKFE